MSNSKKINYFNLTTEDEKYFFLLCQNINFNYTEEFWPKGEKLKIEIHKAEDFIRDILFLDKTDCLKTAIKIYNKLGLNILDQIDD